jgi:hypothetical protein
MAQTTPTPLADTLRTLLAQRADIDALPDIAALYEAVPTPTPDESLEYAAYSAAYDARERELDAAIEVARVALAASDEPRAWRIREDSGAEQTIIASSLAEALEEAVAWSQDGDYDEEARQATIYITVRAECDLTGETGTDTAVLQPQKPDCVDGREHDWQSPHALVGGLAENPGVWGHGGGVIIHEACLRCGCGRTTDTWAQRPDTGEQGFTEVSYQPGEYDLDVARAE